jgi:hypothetical protein
LLLPSSSIVARGGDATNDVTLLFIMWHCGTKRTSHTTSRRRWVDLTVDSILIPTYHFPAKIYSRERALAADRHFYTMLNSCLSAMYPCFKGLHDAPLYSSTCPKSSKILSYHTVYFYFPYYYYNIPSQP